MAVTRADVARLAGVSPALVSYVLNPGLRPVSAAARKRIEAAITELSYQPDAIAQALRRSSSHSIGLLLSGFTNLVSAVLAEFIEENLRSQGFVLLTGNTGGLPQREADYVRLFLSRRVDAIIMISASSHEAIAAATEHGVPVIALDTVPVETGASSIRVDARGGAEDVVRHLMDAHGHSRVACITAEWPSNHHVQDRVAGWRDAMTCRGVPVDERLLVRAASFDRAGGRSAINRVLDDTDATAVFVTSDVKAVGVLDGLRSRRVRVPDELAVTAFGGTVLAETTHPRLTTVNQFMPVVARLAAERVVAKIGKNGEGATHDVLPTELIIRESCGCNCE